jgi:hypothetical protein
MMDGKLAALLAGELVEFVEWHAEISRVFTVQVEANAELRGQAAAAARIDVLAVRASLRRMR